VADLEHATHALAAHGVDTSTFTRADTSAGTSWQLLELAGGPGTALDVCTDLRVQAS
jgi:hypothetical protein